MSKLGDKTSTTPQSPPQLVASSSRRHSSSHLWECRCLSRRRPQLRARHRLTPIPRTSRGAAPNEAMATYPPGSTSPPGYQPVPMAQQPPPPPYSPEPTPIGFGAPAPPPHQVTVVTTAAPPPPRPVVVVAAQNCRACSSGVLVNEFTCCGICLGIFFFPLGLLCCFLMRRTRCSHCRATYS